MVVQSNARKVDYMRFQSTCMLYTSSQHVKDHVCGLMGLELTSCVSNLFYECLSQFGKHVSIFYVCAFSKGLNLMICVPR